MSLTSQEIDQISKEIEDFKNKAMQYASSSPTLSAHYHRLYLASKISNKSFDRAKRSQEDKAYREKRKQARGGKTASASSGKK